MTDARATTMKPVDLIELGVIIGRVSDRGPYEIAVTLAEIVRIAHRLSVLDVRACNEQMPEGYGHKWEQNLERHCKVLGPEFRFERQGDHRGPSVYLFKRQLTDSVTPEKRIALY